jgi:hypothetical protein
MKLRSQISLLLFMFGLVPLLVGFAINVPMIFDRIEKLYHKAHLQNLRAGFGDLDQHIARRHEMVRLLAKMPEPGFILGDDEPKSSRSLEQARKAYVDWVNQVLLDQFDINEILYLDENDVSSFWLDRNRKTGLLEPRKGVRNGFAPELVNAGRKLNPGGVLTGPILFDRAAETESPSRFMQLSLVSPIVIPMETGDSGELTEKRGTVIMYLDMGGLASAYRGNYWVQSDGHYLGSKTGKQPVRTAFEDFEGLEEIFSRGELALWEYEGQQVTQRRSLAPDLLATDRRGAYRHYRVRSAAGGVRGGEDDCAPGRTPRQRTDRRNIPGAGTRRTCQLFLAQASGVA